jgi:hypothetical protein
MAIQSGKGHIFGLSGATLGCASLSGYVSPNLQAFRLTHNGDTERINGQDGEIGSLIHKGEFLELEFTVIPEGSSVANARLSAGLPVVGQVFGVSGLPVLAIGQFVDALNTVSTNTQPWFYEGGGSINGSSTEKATMTLPLKRYYGITSGTPVT